MDGTQTQKGEVSFVKEWWEKAKEKLALTWVSDNHPSIIPVLITIKAKSEPHKRYMLIDDLEATEFKNYRMFTAG